MTEALGGILFIDEAYAMIPKEHNVGNNRVYTPDTGLQTLMENMTTSKFEGNLVVILAGYRDEIEKLMDVNPGVRSRFDKRSVVFFSWTAEQATNLASQIATRQHISFEPRARQTLLANFSRLTKYSVYLVSTWGEVEDRG